MGWNWEERLNLDRLNLNDALKKKVLVLIDEGEKGLPVCDIVKQK